MGKNNSSILRVVPLAKQIENNPALVSEILGLLGIKNVEFGDFSAIWYGDKGRKKEKGYDPSIEHLLGILHLIKTDETVRCYAKKATEKLKDEKVRQKRLEYIQGINCEKADEDCVQRLKWTILETKTKPDLVIENDKYILIAEGKLTENDITTHTTYLPNRDQMIRHIQGALCEAQVKGKRIFAFFIIANRCSYKKKLEKDAFIERIEQESVKIQDNKSKEEIINSYIGYTTWEDIEALIKKNNPSFNFPSIT